MIGLILFIYTVVLLTLFFYSLHPYVLLFFHLKFRKTKKTGTYAKPVFHYPQDFPFVTVQLPIYNEKNVVRRLINSVLMLDYPQDKLEIQILDDSTDVTTAIVKEVIKNKGNRFFDIKHIRREARTGFKAGALQFGLEQAKGEFIAVFDADFVPPRDFLKNMIVEFATPNIGAVQARWGHINDRDSILTMSQAISLDNHFINEQGLRNRAGCFISFNGTCGVWRKSAIIDAGGWSGDTLAEDLDLSYRVQLKGWRIKYRGDVLVPGELPDNVDSFRLQQNRWAKGTFQVAKKLLGCVLRSELGLLTKYEAFVHLTCHINFVAMLLLGLFSFPIIFFKVENIVADGYFIFASCFTVGAFGYPLLYFFSQKLSYTDYKRRIPYIASVIAYSMGLSVSNTWAIIEALLHRRNVFVRTPKSGGTMLHYVFEERSLIPAFELLFGVYMVIVLCYALFNAQYIIVPFLCAYSYGFLKLGFNSIKGKLLAMRQEEVLCSKEHF